ncbi:glutamyl-tRNA(Gln) amidotransferase subunit B, mitochondrial [[Candida] anglica]|uniref:Glutamyl-tRNA(Gln) amidotransferase subunit B, mitochondrial n=1 Tax=[Candida] anglica TaxID=148631 RepID=A0ABP0EHU8_9ASCO
MVRFFSTSRCVSAFRPLVEYQLKCGLELHTQLKTKHKLFSLTPTSFNADPNTKVSYFDCGLPGTQPRLNPEALLLALKAAVALDCQVQPHSRFDRKHYFYPDQPLGYQITQHHKPIAFGGSLELKQPFDDIKQQSKTIHIQQIQIEQDTGKSIYDADGTVRVDLNRANTPLIELVTDPDFEDVHQVKAFIKKYQLLVKHLNICTGELDTGAIRVDVNISVNGNSRVEIKNLRNTTDIVQAIEYEYFRQVDLIKQSKPIELQTRGWNGIATVLQRSKENAVDYRYFPDSELPHIDLDPKIVEEIRQELPKFPDVIATELISKPYNLELKHAKFLVENQDLLGYYKELAATLIERGIPIKFASNWLFNNVTKAFKKLDLEIDPTIVPPQKLANLISFIAEKKVNSNTGDSILSKIIKNPGLKVEELVKEETIPEEDLSAATLDLCKKIIQQNPDVVEKIKGGKAKSIKFLIGLAMKQSRGRANSKELEEKFKNLLEV